MVNLKQLAEVLNKHGWDAGFDGQVLTVITDRCRIIYGGVLNNPELNDLLLDLLESKGVISVSLTETLGRDKVKGYEVTLSGHRPGVGWFPFIDAKPVGSTRTEAISNAVLACDEAGLLGEENA